MANFDTMTVTVSPAGTRRQIIDDLDSSSFVKSSGPTGRILALEITPRGGAVADGGNVGAAMYFGRNTVSSTYGSRIPKGVSKSFDFGGGSINVKDIYMDADATGDKADIVFTLE